jgi:hypothetical protein
MTIKFGAAFGVFCRWTFVQHLRITTMSAYLALLLAVLSRVLPHAFQAVSLNLTAVGGSLLFFGARRPRWQALVAILALAATDYYLTVYAYNFPFHVGGYIVTWAWYGAICLLGSGLLAKRATALRVAGAVLASATSFFVLSNFMVWIGGTMYPATAAGLGACYIAAVPFYANDLISTAFVAGALFGVPALARNIVATLHEAQDSNHPYA